MQRSIGLRVASRQQQQHSSFRWCCQPLLRVATSSSCSRLYYTHHHHHHRYFSSSSSSSSSRRASRKRWTLDAATGIVSSLDDDDTEQPRQQRRFQTIIGLEIHAQLDIPTKLFSPALTTSSSTSTTATARPNDYENLLLHPLDAAIPGYLPVLSQQAVQAALVAATVLNCQHIPAASRFERKHYSYADLPLGYQITQQRWPLARNGFVQVAATAVAAAPVDMKKKKKSNKKKSSSSSSSSDFNDKVTCRINRIQLEQDTGKTTTTTTTTTIQQKQSPNSQVKVVLESSRVDLNRAGCALLEIVTEPDLHTPRDAARIVETIRQLLTHVKVCTGRMERGHLRVDLNVNIEQIIIDSDDETTSDDQTTSNDSAINKKRLKRKRSPRVEVKNLNSIRQVQQAAEYEVLRQAREWQDNDDIDNNSDNNDSNSRDDDSERTRLLLLQEEETRTWNASTKQTILIRRKDQEHDYRFLPEPDLPPLVLYPPATVKSNKKNGGALLDDDDDDDNNNNNNNSNNDQHCDDDDDDDSYYLFPNETAMHNYIQATMPELPNQAVQRLVTQYGLSDYQARVITSDPPAIAYFDQAYASTIHALLRVRQQQQNDDNNNNADCETRHDKTAVAVANMVANYLCNDLFGLLKDHHQHQQHHHPVDDESFDSGGAYAAASLSIQDSPVTAEQLGELVTLVLNGIISKTMAKNLLAILYNTTKTTTASTSSDDDGNNNMPPLSVAQIAVKHGFQLVSDPVQLRRHVQTVLRNDVEAHDLERYFTMDHKVRAKLLKFFTGQCMAASKGNAEPEALREALEQVLLQMQQERK